ncbi:hypothetical protein [Paenilisteria rocourtiae]|uniref:Uncharacterized protein n=1 Tax=Listeria rocourtiae TaxID=647910 RepID=A0A4R6ZFX7_9LIST|nr:hypothetical protein [Listeria rocourtiae]EUJ47535.1 hypothetical protein PROCOU_08904 [Listeria rocourtiae FSL F6-920]MBC1436488.1 hypothetical protein [Listeria rocourtiae]MBC1605284.1 hypothetical protein [Listeria rocourtiae]TDR50942.1 hypothetical protein DFP96_11640 [Listeria rocourtiae]
MVNKELVKEKLCALALLEQLNEKGLSFESIRKGLSKSLSVYDIKQIVYILDTFTTYDIVAFEMDGQDRVYNLTPLGKRLI